MKDLRAIVFGGFPEMGTERLRLRASRPEDAQAIFSVLSSEEVCRFYSLTPLASVEEARALIARRAAAFADRERIRWALARREDDRVIGSCGFVGWDEDTAQAEIGYELAPAVQGHGLMQEALAAVLDFGFDRMQLRRVEAYVVPENLPSRRLLQRLGFQDESLKREHGFWKGQSHDQILLALSRKDQHE